jgi:hypothetical protein
MGPVTFGTTRLQRGNFLFPATLEVTDEELIYTKRHWLIKRKTRVAIRDIVSLHVKNARFSSEFLIKRRNGAAPVVLKAIHRSDADRIRTLVERILGV